MPEDEEPSPDAEETHHAIRRTRDSQTETPRCGSTETLSGSPCSFPVDNVEDRCYVHDDAAPWPTDDPVAFLDRASTEPPADFRAAIAQADADHGGLLAEHFVRYARLLGTPVPAAQLAQAATAEHELAETLFADGLYEPATDSDQGETRLRPEVNQFLQASRRVRLLRKEFGLTAHSGSDESITDLTALWTDTGPDES